MVIYGDKLDEKTKSGGQMPLSEQPARRIPVVGPIWRGGLEIIGGLYRKLDGLEGFMPKASYSKVVQVIQSMQPSLYFSMKKRRELWPKNFNELGAAHHNIELFIFPEISRSETDYDNLVEYMISNDLALTSNIGDTELIFFTSLEQRATKRQKIQGKYYLWGFFKEKEHTNNKAFKRKKASAARRISRDLVSASCLKQPNISPHNLSIENIATGSSSLVTCNLIPFWGPECKRARSKRRRISPKEGDLRKACIAGLSVKEMSDQPSRHKTITIVESLTGNAVHTEVHQQECVSEVTLQMTQPGSVNNEVHDTSARAELAIPVRDEERSAALNNIRVSTCHTNVKQKACEVDDKSNYQDLQGPILLMDSAKNITSSLAVPASPSGEILRHHNSMTISGIARSPAIRSPVLTASSDVNKTSSDKHVAQVVECAQGAQNCIMYETEEAEQPNWESDMDIDEPSVFAIPEKQTDLLFNSIANDFDGNVQANARGLNEASVGLIASMDQPDPLASSLPIQLPEWSDLQSQRSNVSQVTDPRKDTCSIPLLDYKEESAVREPSLASNEEINPCLNYDPARIILNSVVADHHKDIEDEAWRVNKTSTGPNQLAFMEDQLEMHDTSIPTGRLESSAEQTHAKPGCQASNLHEYGSCRTPLLDLEEQSGASACSSTATCVLSEISDKETIICETSEFKDTSDILTSTSILKMAGNYYESSSDMVLTNVGRYMIKSDLAPILTKILDKYGDIALGCSIMPEIVLQKICKVFQELESVPLSGLRRHHVDNLRNVCQLAEALGVNVIWLSKRCADLEEIALQISQYPSLKSEIVRCNKDIQSREEKLNSKRATLAKLQEEIKCMEGELELVKEHGEKLRCEAESMKSVSRRFIGRSLADGSF